MGNCQCGNAEFSMVRMILWADAGADEAEDGEDGQKEEDGAPFQEGNDGYTAKNDGEDREIGLFRDEIHDWGLCKGSMGWGL